jgi:hypothetical protein
MKISIYIDDDVMYAETEGFPAIDGSTGIDTAGHTRSNANALASLLRNVVNLSKEDQEKLIIETEDRQAKRTRDDDWDKYW